MHKFILASLLVPTLAIPAFACSGSTGYELDSFGAWEPTCSNMMGPALAAGASGGGATPVPNRSQSYGGGNSGWVWDSSPVTNALGAGAAAFGTAAAATGNKALGVIGGMLGLGAMASDAAANGQIGISPQSVTSAPDGVGIGPGPSGEGD